MCVVVVVVFGIWAISFITRNVLCISAKKKSTDVFLLNSSPTVEATARKEF